MSNPTLQEIDKAELRIFQVKAIVNLIGAADIDRLKGETLEEASILLDDLMGDALTAMGKVGEQAVRSIRE